MINIKQALTEACHLLKDSSSPRIDAEILLGFTLNVSRVFLYTYPDNQLTEAQWLAFQTLMQRRAIGIPIAYLTEQREFWSLALQVNSHTLIPRPETELLVEQTLLMLAHKSDARILDLGTGSGAIALALAKERPLWNILACDKSSGAVEIARINAQNLQLTNVQIILSDWFSAIEAQRFDAIISNPPYIPANDPHLTQGDIRFEPKTALVSGNDGLDDIRYIISESNHWLHQGGLLLLEHGYDQALAVANLLRENGYQCIETWHDHQDHARISGGYTR